MATKIKAVEAQEILDSRGWPTLEATIILDNGLSASASVPAGSSLNNSLIEIAFELMISIKIDLSYQLLFLLLLDYLRFL